MSRKAIDVMPILMMLAARFPATFSVFERRRRPLKIGISDDIRARFGNTIAAGALSAAMRVYCGNAYYLKACIAGAARIDLEGNTAGTVTPEHAQGALLRLETRRAKRRARVAMGKPPKAEATDEPPKPAMPEPEVITRPKRLGLADLRRMARERKAKETAS